MKVISVLGVTAFVFCVSCERHDFDGPEGTRQLHEHGHADHDHADHDHAGHDHADHDHATPEEQKESN